jgi:transposase
VRSNEVVLEATGNTNVFVRLLTRFVRGVVVANPLQLRAIAQAKVKTDKVDTSVLAKLRSTGFLPELWIPNEDIEALRRRIAERNQLVVADDVRTASILCYTPTLFRAMPANC